MLKVKIDLWNVFIENNKMKPPPNNKLLEIIDSIPKWILYFMIQPYSSL